MLNVYREMLEASCAKKRARIERLLGAPIAPIDAALRVKVDATGKSFGGKKEFRPSTIKKDFLSFSGRMAFLH